MWSSEAWWGLGPLAPARRSLPPAAASPLVIFMEHHRPETLAKPKTSGGKAAIPGAPC